MKKYKIDGYTILNALPYSFQLPTEDSSYKLQEFNPEPEANSPFRIEIETESLNDDHVLMYTPKLYMRFNWHVDPDEGGNGQMEMGHTDFSKDYNQFIQWNVSLNGLPESLIKFITALIRDPSSGNAYQVPLYTKDPNEPNTNENNNARFLPELNNAPPPPPPPSPPKSAKKKRVFKIAKKRNKTQRRRRNV